MADTLPGVLRPSRPRSGLIALATVAAALAAVPEARASDFYWAGGNHDNLTDSNYTNTSGGATSGDAFYFGTDPTGRLLPLDANGRINFDVTSYSTYNSMSLVSFGQQPWTVGGNYLSTGGGRIRVLPTSPSVTMSNNFFFRDISPHFDDAYPTLELDVATQLTLSGLLQDTGVFTTDHGILNKNGLGTVVLTNTNTYTGGTNVNAGRLVDYHPHGNYRDDGELEFRTVSGSLDFGGTVFGSGRFIKSGAGTLRLTGAISYAGDTAVSEGRLIMNVPQSGKVDVAAGAAFEIRNAGNGTFGGNVTGEGTFTKSGSGTLTLAGLTTNAGGTIVKEGTLVALNPYGDYAVDTQLEMRNEGDVYYTGTGTVSGKGSLVKTGLGTLYVADNTHTGGTTVKAGRLGDYTPRGNYVNDAQLEFLVYDERSYAAP